MEPNAQLAQQVLDLLPKSLDDIVRVNRAYLTIRLATDEEIMELHHEILPDREPQMVIDDWRLVAFDKTVGEFCHTDISLLGDRPLGGVRITSPVRKIDPDRGLVITNSGTLYGLGNPGEGEPPFEHLAMICAACHSWGFGSVFGIPYFFY